MEAKIVADKLKAAGVRVIDFTEGDDNVHGEVFISATVYVQVPTYRNAVAVVKQRGKYREFYPPRRSIDALLEDLGRALDLAAA